MSILRQFIQEAESMASAELANNVVSFRETRAKRIKELAQQWAENTVELGKELKAVQETFPKQAIRGAAWTRPGWQEWLKDEIGLSESYARRLIQIAERFGARGAVAVASIKVLELLAPESIPEAGREEVLTRLESGEKIGKAKAVEIVNKHRPAPDEARKIAKETGKPTLARDGNIYLGATKEQEKQTEARREMVFGVRRAIDALAAINVTPEQFLKHALPHQLWTVTEEHVLDEALDWLTELKAAWESRR